MRDAAIKVCMITGDKLETATNIALSARIFSPETDVNQVVECEEVGEVERLLKKIIAKVD